MRKKLEQKSAQIVFKFSCLKEKEIELEKIIVIISNQKQRRKSSQQIVFYIDSSIEKKFNHE